MRRSRRRWPAWWEAAAADPLLAGHVAERRRRHVDAGHHGTESTQLATHVEALSQAGFTEVGTLWQRGDNRLLCAVLPQPLIRADASIPEPALDHGQPGRH